MSLFSGILIIVFSLLIGVMTVMFLIVYLKSHRLRVRDPLHQKGYIADLWMMEKKDKKTGILHWKNVFWQPKLVLPEPPKDAIDIGKKGRKFAEAYKLSEDEFVWISDKGIKVETDDRGKIVAYDVDESGKYKKIDSFKPFTTTQRQVLVHQFIKSDIITKKKWSPAEIMGIVSMGGLVMVILVIAVFGADLLGAYNSVASTHLETARVQAETQRSLALLAQSLGVSVEGMEVVIAQTPPPEEQGEVIVQQNEEPPITDKLKGLIEG